MELIHFAAQQKLIQYVKQWYSSFLKKCREGAMCRFKDPFSWMAGSVGGVFAVDAVQDWACLSIQLDSIQKSLDSLKSSLRENFSQMNVQLDV